VVVVTEDDVHHDIVRLVVDAARSLFTGAGGSFMVAVVDGGTSQNRVLTSSGTPAPCRTACRTCT
jgi:hypothetical protein